MFSDESPEPNSIVCGGGGTNLMNDGLRDLLEDVESRHRKEE